MHLYPFLELAQVFCHFTARAVLIYLLKVKGNASGVSLQTQFLSVGASIAVIISIISFATFRHISSPFANIFITLLDVICTSYTLYILLMDNEISVEITAQNDARDTIPWQTIVCGCIVLALIVNFKKFELAHFCITFTSILRVMTMVPQLLLFRHNRDVPMEIHTFIGGMCMTDVLSLFSMIVSVPKRHDHEDLGLPFFGWFMNIMVVLKALSYIDFIAYHVDRLDIMSRFTNSVGRGGGPSSYQPYSSVPAYRSNDALLTTGTGTGETIDFYPVDRNPIMQSL